VCLCLCVCVCVCVCDLLNSKIYSYHFSRNGFLLAYRYILSRALHSFYWHNTKSLLDMLICGLYLFSLLLIEKF